MDDRELADRLQKIQESIDYIVFLILPEAEKEEPNKTENKKTKVKNE